MTSSGSKTGGCLQFVLHPGPIGRGAIFCTLSEAAEHARSSLAPGLQTGHDSGARVTTRVGQPGQGLAAGIGRLRRRDPA